MSCDSYIEQWVRNNPASIESKVTSLTATPLPSGHSNSSNISVQITGSNIQGYRYLLGPSASTNCSVQSAFSAQKSIDQNLLENLALLPDGPIRLCIRGVDSSGVELPEDQMITAEWVKDTVAPTLSASTSITEIDSTNVTQFAISGSCDQEGGTIEISELSGAIATNLNCVGGVYNGNLDMTAASDGPIVLNLISRDAAGNNVSATISGILKDVGAPAVLSFATFGAKMTEGNTPVSVTVQSSIAKPYDTQISFVTNGDAALGVAHDLAAGTITLPAGQTSASIAFNAFNNIAVDRDRRLIISLTKTNRRNFRLALASHYSLDFIDVDSASLRSPIVDFSLDSDNATCVLHANGHLRCWGNNHWGQVGDGTGSPRYSPIRIGGTTTYKNVVSSGGPSTCALTTSDTVQCWGWGAGGQLGYGGTGQQNSPVTADGGATYQMVDGGGAHACGINSANKLRCWGYNPNGNVGDGTITNRPSPITIDGTLNYSFVGVGDGMFTCAVTSTGALKCWGSNYSGQLGDGTTTERRSPVPIDASTTYSKVSAGVQHTCALTTGGLVKCWGDNTYGQLGTGNTSPSLTPVAIDITTVYSSISVGYYASCGITNTGAMKCWGKMTGGLGTSLNSTNVLEPTFIDPGTIYTKVKTIGDTTCGITASNDFKCFTSSSDNGGFPFSKSIFSIIVPTQIQASQVWKKVARGGSMTCAINSSDKLFCWGTGAVGDGISTYSFAPVAIRPDLSFSLVKTENGTTCAITTIKKLYCWGVNNAAPFFSSLVSSAITDAIVLEPYAIDPTLNYNLISRGFDHNCGLTDTNLIRCWG